jgi:hypothetical protein
LRSSAASTSALLPRRIGEFPDRPEWGNPLKDDLQRYFGWNSAAQREKFFRETVCLGVMRTRRGQVVRGVAIIPVDRARATRQAGRLRGRGADPAAGLPNDSDRVFPSIFNDRSTDEFLSPLDVVLLRMLYDPRLKAGMDRGVGTRPLARQIATELIRAGGIAYRPSRQRTRRPVGVQSVSPAYSATPNTGRSGQGNMQT